jgi:large subunit ribosomal protein L17
MRHRKHNHLLGVKTQHRKALMSNLCAALIKHGRIETTLAKAKAIRPAVEKMITRAKKAKAAEDSAVSLHHRRQCARHLRDKEAAHILFNDKVDEFENRSGGYVRIYKLGDVRLGDSAEMAIVELIRGDDDGYATRRKKKSSKPRKEADSKKDLPEESSQDDTANEPRAEVVVVESAIEDTSEENADAEISSSRESTEETQSAEQSSVEDEESDSLDGAQGDELETTENSEGQELENSSPKIENEEEGDGEKEEKA